MATATGRIDAKALQRSAGEVADLLRALANDRRMLILCRLVEDGEATVGALAKDVGVSQSALSQHLAACATRVSSPSAASRRRSGTGSRIPGSAPCCRPLPALLPGLIPTPRRTRHDASHHQPAGGQAAHRAGRGARRHPRVRRAPSRGVRARGTRPCRAWRRSMRATRRRSSSIAVPARARRPTPAASPTSPAAMRMFSKAASRRGRRPGCR